MKFLVLVAVAAVMGTTSAQAATIFTDRAAFDAATIGATSQTFASSLKNTQQPIYTLNGVTFDTSKAGDRIMLQDGLFKNAIYLATGVGGSVTISSTLNAIGLYIGSAEGQVSFGYNAGGSVGTVKSGGATSSGTFIGFSDSSPISVTFNLANGREFDILSYVTTTNPVVTPPTNDGSSVSAVPEPATWAMILVGFGAIGGAMRRRTSAAARRVSAAR